MHELLSPEQMNEADRLTIAGGTPGIDLMQAAGRAVSQVLLEEYANARKILILCGGGNNGGDGLIAARDLAMAGLDVALYFTGDKNRIRGDAALALAQLGNDVGIVEDANPQNYDLIIDAIFGAGLDRAIEGKLAALITEINDSKVPVLAIDLPSGIDGASGQVLGVAIKADASVTFFRKKPGHLLFPGRHYCGNVVLRQIGIRPNVLKHIAVTATLNGPNLWRTKFPMPEPSGHKYLRGHTLAVSGPLAMSGAARLVAGAALRSGSGLVTLASTKDVLAANAAQLSSVMLYEASSAEDLEDFLKDKRINCAVMGPGMKPDQATRDKVLKILGTQRHIVLDAGALSAFGDDPDELFSSIKANKKSVVLTPHEGEFAKLFEAESRLSSKVERAEAAAKKSGAVIVLKGPDTIVAAHTATTCIADNAPAWLATAGSGDVLAGIIAALLAQNMPAFEAAAAAVWIHGDAANRFGYPLISSDLDEGLRQSLAALI